MLCSDKKSEDFRMQRSFDKVVLIHNGITKSPEYLRIQGIFNGFRDKRTKSKPILRYGTSPNQRFSFLRSKALQYGKMQALKRIRSGLAINHFKNSAHLLYICYTRVVKI